jgi:tRNA(Ile)-lysidine synthase
MSKKKPSARGASVAVGNLPQQALQALQHQGMVRAGDRVGVAVSGGADSVALLLLLLELREKLGIVLSVVHFNHKLRGKASDADEEFVAKLAARHGLEFHSDSADVARKARQQRANLEDTARRARYDYFRSLVDSGACTRMAVAHTADDQAETVLAHILRGTGLAGLSGIHPQAGTIFRPLLTIRRSELRAYLRRRKQSWREDATNRDTKRMRARIRKKLLPLLEKQFQPNIVEHMTTLATLAREDEAFLDALLEERIAAAVQHRDGALRIALADLCITATKTRSNTEIIEGAETTENRDNAAAMSKRIVRHVVKSIKARAGQLSARHVESVLALARLGQTGSSLALPGGVEVLKERDALVFRRRPTERSTTTANANGDFEYSIDLARGTQVIEVPELGCVFRLRVIDWPSERGETNNREMVLDRERLRFPLVLRNWRPGDRLRPSGHQNAHKLKRLLNQKHISRWEREGWPVLASGPVLVWARGFPVAAGFAADERTRAGIVISEEQL